MSGSPCSLKAGLPQRKGVLLETTHVGGGPQDLQACRTSWFWEDRPPAAKCRRHVSRQSRTACASSTGDVPAASWEHIKAACDVTRDRKEDKPQ